VERGKADLPLTSEGRGGTKKVILRFVKGSKEKKEELQHYVAGGGTLFLRLEDKKGKLPTQRRGERVARPLREKKKRVRAKKGVMTRAA